MWYTGSQDYLCIGQLFQYMEILISICTYIIVSDYQYWQVFCGKGTEYPVKNAPQQMKQS